MSTTIDLSPEREARLNEFFGSPVAFRVWLEGVIALTVAEGNKLPNVLPDREPT